jgi:hypothetical protein
VIIVLLIRCKSDDLRLSSSERELAAKPWGTSQRTYRRRPPCPFQNGYMFRLAENAQGANRLVLFRPLLPLVRAISPPSINASEELERAMMRAAQQGHLSGFWGSRDLIAFGSP